MPEDVQFEEGGLSGRRLSRAPGEKGIIGFLIRKNIVSTVDQANKVLLGVLVVVLLITAWVVWDMLSVPEAPEEVFPAEWGMEDIQTP